MYACVELFCVSTNVSNKFVFRRFPLRRRGGSSPLSPPACAPVLKTRLDEVYPNVFIALRIILSCPDTVASPKRSLSKLKLIKTFKRSQITDIRLSSLGMLSIEASFMCSLDLDDVMKALACQKTRSKPF